MSAVRVHDFTQTEGIDRSIIRGLSTIFENFARHAAIDLSTMTRKNCEIWLTDVIEQPWSESVERFGADPYVALFSVSPLAGQCALSIPLPTAMRILELRLGGGQGAPFLGHLEPTETDFGVLKPVFQNVISELSNAFVRIIPLVTNVMSQEVNLQFVQIASPQDLCLVASFEMAIGDDGSAPMSVWLPQSVTRHIVEIMREQNRPAVGSDDGSIATAMMAVPLEVILEIPATELMPDDVVSLQVGDVIRLHHPKQRPLDVRAGGVLVARARHGRSGSRVVCSIVEEVTEG